MTFNHLHTTLLLSLSALTACSDQDVMVDNPSTGTDGKTPIELSVGGVDAPAMTRAVVTDRISGRMKAFTENTSLYMLMQSDFVGTPADANKTPKVTRTIMFALPQTDTQKDTSSVNYSASNEYDKFVRYWDDTYARDAAISIIAVCTPGMGPNVSNQNNTKAWRTGGNTAYANQPWTAKTGDSSYPSISWPIGNDGQVATNKFLTDQSLPFDEVSYIKNQDLCFSNNLNDYTSKSGTDRRIKFNSTTKKFERGELVFYHALSKLTFQIKMGEGFNANDFKFKDNTNIKLTNFFSSGTFNLENGEFVSTSLKKANGETGQNQPIDRIHQRTLTQAEAANYKYILDALVIPGTDMTSTDNAVTFILAGNEYKLSMAQLYAAFTETQKSTYFESGKLKAGVHYVFTFTVSKTQIGGLTAQIVPWETVEASNLNPSNAQITLQLEERGSAISNDVNVYRSAETASTITTDITSESGKGYVWDEGYGDANLYDYDNTTKKLQTSWYWPDNTTFYHFRAVAPTSLVKKTDNNKEYVELNALENTSTTSTPSYTDVTWGAPFKDIDASAKLSYSASTGFDATTAHQIHPAIGTTDSEVKLLMFHMMSDVTIKVESVTGDGAVQLGNGNDGNCTTIKLEKIYKSGKVYLGNGLVEGVLESDATAKGDYSFTSHPAPNSDGVVTWSNYGAIPQDLGGSTPSDATDDVILVITTPDHNEYRVSMKDVLGSSVSSNNIANPYTSVTNNGVTKYKIDRWYPGFQYTYNFKLSKKKIESITATILDWENVTAGDDNVQIK